jgi:hypothetical protein
MKQMQEDGRQQDGTEEQSLMLDELQRDALSYFVHEFNPANGLVADKTLAGWPASIAATGLALPAYLVGVERGWMDRQEALSRSLATMRFFMNSPQGQERDDTGYKGFYYHYLDMSTGQRAFMCELSTVDTAYLVAGMLAVSVYFDRDTPEEEEVRGLADEIYRRIDWDWARNRGSTLTHGWKPRKGFLRYRWGGYDESLLLYILALGSPTHSIHRDSFLAVTHNYVWKKVYGFECIYAGPLFIHQYPHLFIDFRQIRDEYMREKGLDYFENSRIATLIHRQYAIRNPKEFSGYDEFNWGITASDGPGPTTMKINGIERVFYDYIARGVPFGPDDGTLAPWAVVASLPFAPEIVLTSIGKFNELKLKEDVYGYKASFNPTFPDTSRNEYGWVSPYQFGINQGPIVLMIENYRTGFLWNLMKNCSYIVEGLRKAGFRGGWLSR